MSIDQKNVLENILKKNGFNETNDEVFQTLLNVVQAGTRFERFTFQATGFTGSL